MKQVKTIKGLLGKLTTITKISVDELKGYDQLPIEDQKILKFLIGDIHNYIGEIKKS